MSSKGSASSLPSFGGVLAVRVQLKAISQLVAQSLALSWSQLQRASEAYVPVSAKSIHKDGHVLQVVENSWPTTCQPVSSIENFNN